MEVVTTKEEGEDILFFPLGKKRSKCLMWSHTKKKKKQKNHSIFVLEAGKTMLRRKYHQKAQQILMGRSSAREGVPKNKPTHVAKHKDNVVLVSPTPSFPICLFLHQLEIW